MTGHAHFRALLEDERSGTLRQLAELRGDMSSVSDARRDSNVDDEHDPEGSTIAYELSQAGALVAQGSQRLEQIEAAMARIDDGSYGSCVVCGRPIAEGRLEARPWTPFCIDHAAASAR